MPDTQRCRSSPDLFAEEPKSADFGDGVVGEGRIISTVCEAASPERVPTPRVRRQDLRHEYLGTRSEPSLEDGVDWWVGTVWMEYPITAFVGITSRTPHFKREDVADRLLLFNVDRLEPFRAESELLRELIAQRNVLMTELVGQLQRVLSALEKGKGKSYSTSFRIADFAQFVLKVADAEDRLAEAEAMFERLAQEQLDRGFSTGARQYGYDKVAVFDPSGRKDADGRPLLLGREIRVNEDEAKVIRQIFEWAAEGVGVASMVDRLNREGVPGTGGKRWSKTPVAFSPTNGISGFKSGDNRRWNASRRRAEGLCATARAMSGKWSNVLTCES